MAICSQSLRAQGKPYPRTCAVCGLGPCRFMQPGFEPMNQNPFSFEENARLAAIEGVNKFMVSLPADTTVGEMRAKVRERFLRPPTVQDDLRTMLSELEADHRVSPSGRDAISRAIFQLDQAARRPIENLRQEAYGHKRDGSPYRWVILWAPSGYITTKWRCEVGRRAPPDAKFAGKFVTHSGECFTDGGEDATHFSELPFDA